MKYLKIGSIIMLILVVLFIAQLTYKGHISREMPLQATYNESTQSLGDCPDKPNCVSSFVSPTDEHYISAHKVSELNLAAIKDFFFDCHSQVETKTYWYYTCKSALFGFVDDIELLYQSNDQTLSFRSASRVGYSDLGANRKRIEKLIQFFSEH